MIKRHNRISFLWGVAGIVLQPVGAVIHQPLITLVGLVLLAVGLAYYAKAKGRHPAWGLCGLLSIIGLLILACLSDRAKENAAVTVETQDAPEPGDG